MNSMMSSSTKSLKANLKDTKHIIQDSVNESIGNAENLISAADEEMYKNKKLMKSRMKSAVK